MFLKSPFDNVHFSCFLFLFVIFLRNKCLITVPVSHFQILKNVLKIGQKYIEKLWEVVCPSFVSILFDFIFYAFSKVVSWLFGRDEACLNITFVV